MHSERPDYGGQRRHHGDRESRRRDDYNDRWQDRGDTQCYSHHPYGGSGTSRAERRGQSTNYGDSPPMLYQERDRDRARRSPNWRCLSSPDFSVAEKKRQRFPDDSLDDTRYRLESDDKKYRQSPDDLSHDFRDFEHQLPQEEDLKYRKGTHVIRNRHSLEEHSSWHQQLNDSTRRRRDRHSQGMNHIYLQDIKLCPYDDSSKRNARSRERKSSSPKARHNNQAKLSYGLTKKRNARSRERKSSSPKDRHHNQAKLSDGLTEKYFEHMPQPGDDVPKEEKLTDGFQRFLDVLNKGVDVDMLNKIVIQGPAGDPTKSQSPASFQTIVEHQCFQDREQGAKLNIKNWMEDKTREKCYEQQRLRSCSPERSFLTHDASGRNGGQDHYHRRSPPVVERESLTCLTEQKQMQGVLQAIGIDLGFEELGQMSHRIQERLYGKKDSDWSYESKGSRQKVTRPAYSPRRHSRSSSSSSASSRGSLIPSKKNHCFRRDSYHPESYSKVNQAQIPISICSVPRSKLPDDPKCEIKVSNFLNIPIPGSTKSSILPTPAYPPPMVFPPLPPNFPNIGPGLLMPPQPFLPFPPPQLPFHSPPPFPPFLCPPPLNTLPSVLGQRRPFLPTPMNNIQLPQLNPPHVPVLPVTPQFKSKTLSRPRCLHVIETKKLQ
ncbi:uncharacterized protein LOC133557619 isoform X1 [Nerophis ophidion]|uniref:uncharacterized protein LOC133557619 isoform X1 n=1 Tax=Nerophis ophidion TaxID=159077 RepID=UPI002ADF05F5|nr:uncharacterized protein LOC133557619 isoform X1 [Nerophis ophidion]